MRSTTCTPGSPQSLRLIWMDLVVVAVAATAARMILLWGTEPALYWDSDTYLGIARYILAHGHPPFLRMRLPGYPLFILLSGGFHFNLTSTVFFQHILGVLTTIFLYLAILTMIRNRPVALIGALVLATMPDILFMEVTVYAETLAICSVACATWLFAAAVIGTAGPGRWAMLGVVTAFGAWTRPTLALLIPIMGFGVFLSEFYAPRATTPQTAPVAAKTRTMLRPLGFFLVPPILLIGGTIAANGLWGGSYRLANGMGFSSLNFVGRPEVYRHLPPDLQWVTRVYGKKENQVRFGYIQWDVVLHPLLDARKQQGLPTSDWDRAALDTALRVARARPNAYLRIWSRTLLAYWGDYGLLFGPWKTERAAGDPARLQVTETQWAIALALRTVWMRLQPVLSVLCFLSLPLVLLDRRWDERRRLVIVVIWSSTLLYSLASTAIESAVGQPRYRMPFVAPIVLLATVALVSVLTVLKQLAIRAKTAFG